MNEYRSLSFIFYFSFEPQFALLKKKLLTLKQKQPLSCFVHYNNSSSILACLCKCVFKLERVWVKCIDAKTAVRPRASSGFYRTFWQLCLPSSCNIFRGNNWRAQPRHITDVRGLKKDDNRTMRDVMRRTCLTALLRNAWQQHVSKNSSVSQRRLKKTTTTKQQEKPRQVSCTGNITNFMEVTFSLYTYNYPSHYL